MPHLQSEEIRDAYFLGGSTDGETLANFFGKYIRHIPCPNNGTCVSSIELETPYVQVAEAARAHVGNYTALDAEKEFSARPAVVILDVGITFAPSYSGPTTVYTASDNAPAENGDTYFYGFRFRVAQRNTILPRRVSEQYSSLGGLSCRNCVNENHVYLEFDPGQLDSGVVHIAVTSPEGRTSIAEFDLDQLK